jgi:hypothetical protein
MASRSWPLAFGVLLGTLAGCTEPEVIRVVDEPKPSPAAAPDVPADQKKFRTLAAMIPENSGPAGNEMGQWWFFKFTGPADVVEKHRPAFDALVASVTLTGDRHDPITWVVPQGWVQVDEGKSQFTYAKLKVGDKDSPVEVTVSKAGGATLMNVNRWRKQLGLDEVTGLQLESATTLREVNGRLVVLTDMAGPKEPPKGGPMMMGQ